VSLPELAGLLVGHHTRSDRATGCTVVLCPEGATAGVDVRGGAPGTRETDLLRSENLVSQVHGILLAGGSAFGLDAASGVMRWLEERGHGLNVGPARIPIVPAAVLFDLWHGDARIRPNADDGYAACQAASAGPIAQGRVGAAAGATVGKLFGPEHSMPGGIGCASLTVQGITVAALVAVNAVGDVVSPSGAVIAGARRSDGGFIDSAQALMRGELPRHLLPGTATTIGVIATDAALSKAQCNKLAAMAHDGLARSIRPIHTPFDGDTLFALATGRAGPNAAHDVLLLGSLAAEVVAQAVVQAVQTSPR
jgi:L-aminopeptidase/D-esterase-like protein